MSITKKRLTYRPLEYPQAEEFWLQQQQAHWLHSEVSMSGDINDWKVTMKESDKQVIGAILKGFTQLEVIVEDYWINKVCRWFPKPEIMMMASTFGAMESVHIKGYAYLDESLGFEDYEEYVQEPVVAAKLANLIDVKGDSKRDIARSLAIFSAFAEGVQLFSSFAILLSFKTRNMMNGVGQIVQWSIRDESLHSKAGCWLFRVFIDENPDIWDDNLKKDIVEAARMAVKLEDDFIEKAFEGKEYLRVYHGQKKISLTAHDMKQYIRMRANTKLGDLGLPKNWKNIDEESIKKMEWFDDLALGANNTDFFSKRPTDYSKGTVDWSQMWREQV